MQSNHKQSNQREAINLVHKITPKHNEIVQLQCNYANNYYGDQLCIVTSTKTKT
jgi:hypothetical protein